MRSVNKGFKCLIEGCNRPARRTRMCDCHYVRKYRNGHTHLIRRENGTGSINHGYVLITDNWDRKAVHTLVAEKALGRKLPKGAVVHHVDRNRQNNDPSNLVICPNQSYHMLLHKRMKELGYE